MKKFIFTVAFSFISCVGIVAQDSISKPEYSNLGLGFNVGTITELYLQFETNDIIGKSKSQTYVTRGGYAGATLTDGSTDVTGVGTFGSITQRQYFGSKKEQYQGFFTHGLQINYTRIKFDELFYKGTYSHLSFFNLGGGYKYEKKHFFAEIKGGYEWLIQIKGKGNVDNRSFDNWNLHVGLTAGYRF